MSIMFQISLIVKSKEKKKRNWKIPFVHPDWQGILTRQTICAALSKSFPKLGFFTHEMSQLCKAPNCRIKNKKQSS